MKSKYCYQFTEKQLSIAHVLMLHEFLATRNDCKIRSLLDLAYCDFTNGLFSYDGPTFAKRRHQITMFEVAAFIHDWRNSKGHVSKEIDQEMFDIMIALNYPLELIIQRWILTRFTWINIIRHKIKNTFINSTPNNLYKL